MGLLCKALHFGIVIYGYSSWELIQMMTAIKWHSWKSYWILWKCYLSHPEHPYIVDPYCTLLWKISTPVWLQMLFETIVFRYRLPYYFICRSCFQMACRGLLNDYSVESTSEPILFPRGPNLSLLPVPENFTAAVSFFSLCAAQALPEGLFLSDLMFRTAVVPGSQDKERGKVLSILLHWAKPAQNELAENLGAKLLTSFYWSHIDSDFRGWHLAEYEQIWKIYSCSCRKC